MQTTLVFYEHNRNGFDVSTIVNILSYYLFSLKCLHTENHFLIVFSNLDVCNDILTFCICTCFVVIQSHLVVNSSYIWICSSRTTMICPMPFTYNLYFYCQLFWFQSSMYTYKFVHSTIPICLICPVIVDVIDIKLFIYHPKFLKKVIFFNKTIYITFKCIPQIR